ncbi:type IV secretion system protein [Paracoccus sp. NBH48]|uniref:type IV secretion system protein n=1 Tax=Paracoccus sp. NBH48 TaxID=2596918 RepID=UPI00210744D8|nr:type IV secretion system protein [Paracoccus sp. NBH48]
MKLLRAAFTSASLSLVLFPASVLSTPTVANAQGVPVIDSRNLLQQLETFQQMLVDMGLQEEQIAMLVEQIELMDQHLSKLGDIENLLSNPTDILELALGTDLDGILEGEFDADMLGTLMQGARGDWSGLQGAGAEAFRGV